MSQVIGKTQLAYSRAWHLVDVGASQTVSAKAVRRANHKRPAVSTPRPLGRIASQIAITLMGKHKPIFSPSTDCGDYVVAVGCHDLHATGKKMQQKKYYTHTTRPGSLKEMTMERLAAKWGGGEILRRAVRGMLPKNRLREKRLDRLKTFEGVAHPYQDNLIRFATSPGEDLPSLLEHPQVKKTLEKERHILQAEESRDKSGDAQQAVIM